MLKILRKHSKHWLIAAVIGAIVVVFIFWGMGSMESRRSQEIALVYDQPISVTTYYQYVNLLEKKARFRRDLSEDDVKALREGAQDNLINLTLLTMAAHRLGLKVSDREVQAAIINDPAFQQDGKFNPRLYEYFIGRGRNRNAQKLAYEDWVRQQLLAAKVLDTITSFAKVSDAELKEYFRLAREAVQVDYIAVSPGPFIARAKPSDAELKAYYQTHQDEFRIPEKIKVRYVVLRSKDFLEQVKITPEEVDDYLQEHRPELVRPQVIRVREIFLALPEKATEAQRRQVKQRAEELLKQVRQGEDFARLARTSSQDEASRKKGGDLGTVSRGQKPVAWEKVAFGLAPGEVGLARTGKGYHLIKVEQIKETEALPAAETKARVKEKLRQAKSRQLARDKAKDLQAETARVSFLEVVKKSNLIPQETTFFTRTEALSELGATRAFNQEAFTLKPQEVGVAEVPQGYAVMQALNYRPAELPAFEKTKDKVRQVMARQQAQKLAEKEAEKLLQRLRQGEPLTQVAAQAGLPLKDSGYFTRIQGFRDQPLAEPLTSASFQLSKQNPYPDQPIFWQGKYYLLAFKNRKLPTEEEFQAAREDLKRRVLQDKRRVILEAWFRQEWQRAEVRKPRQSS
jgi:peptidyl-prolyl cis-trans isomerase D